MGDTLDTSIIIVILIVIPPLAMRRTTLIMQKGILEGLGFCHHAIICHHAYRVRTMYMQVPDTNAGRPSSTSTSTV